MRAVLIRGIPLLLLAGCGLAPAGGGARGKEFAEIRVPPLPDWSPPLPQKARLANGLTVLLLAEDSLPTAEISLRLDVGARDDPRGKTGLAAMTAEVLRDRGRSRLNPLGAGLEAEVGWDATLLRLSCLPSDLPAALKLFASLLREPAFPAARVEQVKARTLAAIRRRNEDSFHAADREARRAFYGIHDPRARRPEEEALQAIRGDDMAAFHRDHFGSRNGVLAVAGPIDPEALKKQLEEDLGAWPVQSAAAPPPPPDLPAPSGRRIVQVRRKGLSQAQVRFVLAGVGIDHPDWPALELASYVLGTGGFSNRLVQGLREEKGLAYREGAGWLPAYDPNGLFWGFFATRNAGTLEALTVTLEIFTRFLEEGVGEEELQQARERFLNAEVFDYDTPVKSLDRVAGLEFHNLPWNLPEKIRRELEGLNPRKVLAAVQRHFDPDRLLIFVLGNEGIPAEELAALGPVEPWSLEGAGPPQASAVAAAEHREAGAALVRGILTSHGGLEAWKAARALQVAWKAPDGSSGIFHLSLPSPTRTSAPPCRLPTVLMELARGKFQAESPAEGRLFLRKGGEDPLLLTVGRDGLVRSLARTGQRPFEEHYGGYALHGGLYLPATCTASSEAGKREIVLSDWQVNPEGEPPR